MYKSHEIDRQKIKDLFYYDESSKSCLKWAKDIYAGQYKSRLNVSLGQDVGALSGGYYITTIDKKKYKVHRLIWALHNGEIPDGMGIDHIDGNKGNNKISNLRLITRKGNMQNRKLPKTNTSGIVGVEYYERTGRSPYYVSRWRLSDGKYKSKSFAISMHGYDGALIKAIRAREEAIKELNNNGQQYTERHGE